MKTWLYSWIIYPVVYSLARVIGSFNFKVRETLRLRSWKDYLSLRFNVGRPIEYWLHVASAGELEYAIPILQELEKRKKHSLITYYSISAKGAVEQLPTTFSQVSLVVPLPHDGLGLMREFVSLIRGQGVRHLLLLKYELWPGLLWECNAQGIKVTLIDALKPSWFHRRLLHKLNGILSGYSSEVNLIDHPNVQVVGDTRVERVLYRIKQAPDRLKTIFSGEFRDFFSVEPTLVCGSMWPPDTAIVVDALAMYKQKHESLPNLIWVPHELTETNAVQAARRFVELGYDVQRIDRLESLSGRPLAVIVMKKGILVELYALGKMAFVGGGFGSGVHSVWEPAIAGALVACGSRTERSPESRELKSRGLLMQVETSQQLLAWLEANLMRASGGEGEVPSDFREDPLRKLLSEHIGAASRIVEICERNSS